MKIIEVIKKWDKKIILKYNFYGGKLFTHILKFFSFFGRETIWFLLIAFFIFIWYDSIFLIHIGASFMNGLILIVPIKQLVNRARPFEDLENIKILERQPTSRSFPSWHAYNAFSQALTFGFLFQSLFVGILLILCAIIVAFSRIQLGVHYPSDSITGSMLGIGGFLLTLFIMNPLFSWILILIEQILPCDIKEQQINPWLTNNPIYLILCILIFSIIILSYFNKRIMKWLFDK